MIEITYQTGSGRRRSFRTASTRCQIGRARDNDIVVDSRKIARHHLEIRLQADGLYVRDLGTSGGTWVNHRRIVDHGPLHEFDEIQAGNLVLQASVLAAADGDVPAVAEPTGSAALPGERNSSPDKASAGTGDQSGPQFADQESLAYWSVVVHGRLLELLDLQRRDVHRMSDAELREEASRLIRDTIDDLAAHLPATIERELLASTVLDEAVGLGPLEPFLADESITEIMVNNHREIFVERAGRIEAAGAWFSSDQAVYAVIERIISPLGRRIDESSPIVDARLKDGSRVNAIIPPLALKGPSVTIRKFPSRALTIDDLQGVGSIDRAMAGFLELCVQNRRSIVVSGGTGSGKTTLLNVLSAFIPDAERIVTIEDAAELRLSQPNLVSLESRPPNLEGAGAVAIRDLVRNALRMRPDRIIVGECRGGEALDMLQAMNTGHEGSLTTVHANNPRDVISRLEVLVLMAGMELPLRAIREQIASAIDIIVQMTRFPCGARKISRITEVAGLEGNTVQLQDLFLFERHGRDSHGHVRGNFRATGLLPGFFEELEASGDAPDFSLFGGIGASHEPSTGAGA